MAPAPAPSPAPTPPTKTYTACSSDTCTWRFDGTIWTVIRSGCKGNCACLDPDAATSPAGAAMIASGTIQAGKAEFEMKVRYVKQAHPGWVYRAGTAPGTRTAAQPYLEGDEYDLPCYDQTIPGTPIPAGASPPPATPIPPP